MKAGSGGRSDEADGTDRSPGKVATAPPVRGPLSVFIAAPDAILGLPWGSRVGDRTEMAAGRAGMASPGVSAAGVSPEGGKAPGTATIEVVEP